MGSGVSGLYSGVYGSNVAPRSANYMKTSDLFRQYISKRSDVDVDGKYDVIAHGKSNTIIYEVNDKSYEIDHRTASKLLTNDAMYNGSSIRLLSCDTGSINNGFAQNLANKMNVIVETPSKLVWAYENGKYLVADRDPLYPNRPNLKKKGKFIKFYPGGKKK